MRDALTIQQLWKEKALEGFGVVGIVKQVLNPDRGLATLKAEYFNFDIYCDAAFSVYTSMGNRMIALSDLFWSPDLLKRVVCDTFLNRSSADGTDPSEGRTKGGILILDPTTEKPRAMCPEKVGAGIPVADLLAALKFIRKNNSSGKR